MLSSSIRTVTDADELRSALRPTDGVLTVTAAGAFKAKVVRIDLLKVGMQHARETAARGWHLTQGPNRAAICFPTQDGPSLVVQGKDLDQTSIALVPANAATWQTLTGPTHWGSISLSLEDWDGLVSTFAGSDLMPRNATSVIVTNRPALAALQRRQLAAVHLAETAPELLGNRDVARGLE